MGAGTVSEATSIPKVGPTCSEPSAGCGRFLISRRQQLLESSAFRDYLSSLRGEYMFPAAGTSSASLRRRVRCTRQTRSVGRSEEIRDNTHVRRCENEAPYTTTLRSFLPSSMSHVYECHRPAIIRARPTICAPLEYAISSVSLCQRVLSFISL